MDGSAQGKLNKNKKRKLVAGNQPVKLAQNPFNMTARNFSRPRSFAKNTTKFLDKKGVHQQNSPAQALEQVRAALQPSLNRELEKVLEGYQEMFRMAAYNIGDNMKESVTEDHISNVVCNSLEEAKKLFKMQSEAMDDKVKDEIEKTWTPARNVIIRKKKMRRDKKEILVKDNFDYPSWYDDKITDEVEMIMGVKASNILGYASASGRLYTRHPQLFRYISDKSDKIWLLENGHMANIGGKACLMLADDIRLIATTHPDYKDKLGIKADDIKGFHIPDFMTKKVKSHMKKQALIQKVRKSVD